MSSLDWDFAKVRNLTGPEIWLFIVARVMIGFGAGILVREYLPRIALPLAFPILVVAVILFLVAAKGRARTKFTYPKASPVLIHAFLRASVSPW